MKNIFCLISLFFIVACGTNNENILNHNNSTDIQEVEFLKAQDLFEETQLIPLEANSESLISKVSKLIKNENFYFILDKTQNKLFVFDLEGSFIKSFMANGFGPNELLSFDDITLDAKNNAIELYSFAEKKRLIIDIDTFEYSAEKFQSPFAHEIAKLDTKYFVYFTEILAHNKGVGIHQLNEEFAYKKPILINSDQTTGTSTSGTENPYFYPNFGISDQGVGFVVPPTKSESKVKIGFLDMEENLKTWEYDLEKKYYVAFPVIGPNFQSIPIFPKLSQQNTTKTGFILISANGKKYKAKGLLNDEYLYPYKFCYSTGSDKVIAYHNSEEMSSVDPNQFRTFFNEKGISLNEDKVKYFESLTNEKDVFQNPILVELTIR